MFKPGFTLIELLIALAIASILAAIAIPQYAEYKQRGFDTASKADLRNAAQAQEAYFADNSQYLACEDTETCAAGLPGIYQFSNGTSIAFSVDGTHFIGTASNPHGSPNNKFTWDNHKGGLQANNT